MRGEYACRSPRLYSLHWICRKLTRSLKFSITHVPRERNAEANGLANSAVRRKLRLRSNHVGGVACPGKARLMLAPDPAPLGNPAAPHATGRTCTAATALLTFPLLI